MFDKFQNKYRIPSARLPNWDYGWNAAYFVTICTKNRESYFGKIIKTKDISSPVKMCLSDIGNIAQKCWLEIPQHFPFVILDEFVVMPNHVHGIIIINKPDNELNNNHPVLVETQNVASLPKNKFGPQSKNLASIIRGFKIGVTKYARKNNIDFACKPVFMIILFVMKNHSKTLGNILLKIL